jgi:urea transport system substrate-binding protein
MTNSIWATAMGKKTKFLGAAVLICVAVGGWSCSTLRGPALQPTIKVGVLHSQSGTMAKSETAVVDATLLAIEEINQHGGLLGKRIEPVIADGGSDWPRFAREAERLITRDHVSVIFGCWTSASRKAVKPIVEKHDHLLFYPVQYEGLEQSPNIIYIGATPNQQIMPGVKWCFDHLGRKMFLVGSDYVFPRTANQIIRDQLAALGGDIVGEAYIPLGSQDVQDVVRKIVDASPDVILNTINGDSNLAFFKVLRASGITPQTIPTMSFSLAEQEILTLGAQQQAGNYATWSYFQSLDTPDNKAFISKFANRYGKGRVTDDPMEAAYLGVHLWAQAVARAGSAETLEVLKAIKNQGFAAPEGMVYIDGETQHAWKVARVGKIRGDGQFEIVWDSKHAIRPMPYPISRSKHSWDNLVMSLYRGWGGNWANVSH